MTAEVASPCPGPGHHHVLGPEALALLAAAYDAAEVALVVLDPDLRLLHLNPAAARLSTPEVPEAVGLRIWEVFSGPGPDGAHALETLQEPHGGPGAGPGGTERRRGQTQLEQLCVGPLGDRHRIAWTFTPLAGPFPGYLTGVGTDVSEHRKAEAVWRQLAQTDPLTGLANRAVLRSALGEHLHPERGLGCGLLFCDLDGFKQVNDTQGHAVGDHVLTQTATRLLSSVRQGDLVARLGGDEFVVVLPAAGEIETRAAAARVERAVARPIRMNGLSLRVGVSVGHCVADTGEDPDTVLGNADAAMYAVKARRSQTRSAG